MMETDITAIKEELDKNFKSMNVFVMSEVDLNEDQIRALKQSSSDCIESILTAFKKHAQLIDSLMLEKQ